MTRSLFLCRPAAGPASAAEPVRVTHSPQVQQVEVRAFPEVQAVEMRSHLPVSRDLTRRDRRADPVRLRLPRDHAFPADRASGGLRPDLDLQLSR